MRMMGPKVRRTSDPFACELHRLRIAAGMSQHKLGRACDLDHSLISRYEAGQRVPTPETLDLIADALRLTTANRVRLFGAARIWPFDEIPDVDVAKKIATVIEDARLRDIKRAEWEAASS